MSSALSLAPATAADANAEPAVRAAVAKLTDSFAAGQPAEVGKLFLATAELEDESGAVHSGREAIAALAAAFAERFPGAKMSAEIESVTFVAPDIALVEAIRTTTTGEGTETAQTRSSLTLVDRDGQWSVAAIREIPAEEELSPHERLESLSWLVGNWVDEGTDAVVNLACRWSDDGNFLLIEHSAVAEGRTALNTTQRLGWDPLKRQVHSWMFDSDGGYGEGDWTRSGTTWTIRSSAVLPDGIVGSATFTIEPVSADRFVMKSTDRVLGETAVADREVTIVRKPPVAASKPR
jgi:uncharacterized protein (TIGR02246 family)